MLISFHTPNLFEEVSCICLETQLLLQLQTLSKHPDTAAETMEYSFDFAYHGMMILIH